MSKGRSANLRLVLVVSVTSLITALVVVGVTILIKGVFAWTNPTSAPPGGSGVVTTSGGNIGIGTTSPANPLTIAGSVDSLFGLSRSGATYATNFRLGTDSALVVNSGNADVLTLKGGKVGIGTTSPSTLLHISSDLGNAVGTLITLTNSNIGVNAGSNIDFYSGAIETAQISAIRSNVNLGSEGRLVFKALNQGILSPFITTTADGVVYIGGDPGGGGPYPGNGLVVVNGTAIPSTLFGSGAALGSRLRVQADANDFLAFDERTIQTGTFAPPGGTTPGELHINPYGGKVGLGLTAPIAELHVKSPSSSLTALVVESQPTADPNTAIFYVTQPTTWGGIFLVYPNGNIGINNSLFGGGKGVIDIENAVQVPTSNPASGGILYTQAGALKYRGSGGTISGFAADYFEYLPAKENVEHGDIVFLSNEANPKKDDPTAPFLLEKSSRPYDPGLIGVVSSYVGDEKPYGFYQPIALVGRVPVKVSTENGSIGRGDYLTSSIQPGVAMKATQAGRAIGIALESYSHEGIGKIMVLVSPGRYAP